MRGRSRSCISLRCGRRVLHAHLEIAVDRQLSALIEEDAGDIMILASFRHADTGDVDERIALPCLLAVLSDDLADRTLIGVILERIDRRERQIGRLCGVESLARAILKLDVALLRCRGRGQRLGDLQRTREVVATVDVVLVIEFRRKVTECLRQLCLIGGCFRSGIQPRAVRAQDDMGVRCCMVDDEVPAEETAVRRTPVCDALPAAEVLHGDGRLLLLYLHILMRLPAINNHTPFIELNQCEFATTMSKFTLQKQVYH